MMRIGFKSSYNKIDLFLFIIILIAIKEISSNKNLNSSKVNKIKNKPYVESKFRNKNETDWEKKNSLLLNSNIEQSCQKDEIRKFSILISIIWIAFGFIISTLFFLFALLFNNKNMLDINTSSIQIVGSLKDIMRLKISNGESVILKF